jgi:hypothetical protein
MLSAEKASNVSAQSPACNRKPWPAATVARLACRVLASPANTSGGCLASSASTPSRAAGSGQSGCWAAGRARQESGDQASAWAGTSSGEALMASSLRFPATLANQTPAVPSLATRVHHQHDGSDDEGGGP